LRAVGVELFKSAEAFHPVYILPVYAWWSAMSQDGSKNSAASDSRVPDLAAGENFVQKDKAITNLFQKTMGTLSMRVAGQLQHSIKLYCPKTNSANSISIPVQLHYLGNLDTPPPYIKSISSRLLMTTSFNVGPTGGASAYKTNVVLLNAGTPSKSSYMWVKSVHSDELSWDTTLRVCLILPPTSSPSHVKRTKVLLPTFRTCWISRSYELQLKIGLDFGGSILTTVPITILARPSTHSGETKLEEAFSRDEELSPSYESIADRG
jgi:hypothetical protein